MDINDFSIKYIPKNINDIIGCKDQINNIRQWLNNFQKNKKEIMNKCGMKKPKKNQKKIKETFDSTTEDMIESIVPDINTEKNQYPHSCLIIIGNHGTGKTCVINAILKELGYNIETINLSKIGSNKNIMENINKITKGSNIVDKLINKDKIHNALIIDEIQSANSPVEKNYITTLLKINEEKWFYPIIFISNKKHSKFISTIKANSNIVEFREPSDNNIMNLLITVASNEKMCIDNEKTGYKIVTNAQNDYRRLLFFMQNLKLNYQDKQLTSVIIDDYYKLFKKKDLDIDIYKATAKIMTKYEGIDETLKIFESDTVNIPLVMHENFLTYIYQYDHKKKSIDIADNISKSLAFGDIINEHINSDQNWDMRNVYGFYGCVKPSYILSKNGITTNDEYLKRKLEYPSDLNRTSIKFINKKNITNSMGCLKNFGIIDFIYGGELIKKIINEEKYEYISEIFNDYNVKIENIESILKIDKINNSKASLSSNIKKNIAKYINKK